MYWLQYELKCMGAVTQAKPMVSNTNRIIVTNTFSISNFQIYSNFFGLHGKQQEMQQDIYKQ